MPDHGADTRFYASCTYASPLGDLVLAAGDDGLKGAWFAGQKYFGGALDAPMAQAAHPHLDRAREWLDAYFAGERPSPESLALAPVGTPFRLLVWRLLLEIPYGEAGTYAELARKVAIQTGRPRMSAQAVGGAVGHNPLSIVVPCHRVVASDGCLTGYAGGMWRKSWLLEHEGGFRVEADRVFPLSRPS